jgi:addiction module HigA family antidote
MHSPSHPGRIVRSSLDDLGITITDAARALGVTRQTLNNLVNGKAGISAEMAVRLAKGLGSTPDFWLRLQTNYDLAQVRNRNIEVTRLKRAS